IAKPGAHERHDFVPSRLWSDEVGLLGVQLDQLVLECRQLKKIVFFFYRFRWSPTLGAGSAGSNGIHIKFIEDAVLAGVTAFVDVSVIADPAEQLLYAALVFVRSGADVVVIGQSHPVPQGAKLGRDFIGEV